MNYNSQQQQSIKRQSLDLTLIANPSRNSSKGRLSLNHSQQNSDTSTLSCKTPTELSNIDSKIPKDLPKHKFFKSNNQSTKNVNEKSRESKPKPWQSFSSMTVQVQQMNIPPYDRKESLSVSDKSVTPLYSHHQPIQNEPSAFYFHNDGSTSSRCSISQSELMQNKIQSQQCLKPVFQDISNQHSRTQSGCSETKTTPYEIENYLNEQMNGENKLIHEIKINSNASRIVVQDDDDEDENNFSKISNTFTKRSSVPMTNYQQQFTMNSNKSALSHLTLNNFQGESLSSIDHLGSKHMNGNSSMEHASFFLSQNSQTQVVNDNGEKNQNANESLRQQYEQFQKLQEQRQPNNDNFIQLHQPYQQMQESGQQPQYQLINQVPCQNPQMMPVVYHQVPVSQHYGPPQHHHHQFPSFVSNGSTNNQPQSYHQSFGIPHGIQHYNSLIQPVPHMGGSLISHHKSQTHTTSFSSQGEQSIISQSLPCQCTQCLQSQMAYLQQLLVQQQQLYLQQALKEQVSESIISRCSSNKQQNSSLYHHPKPTNLESSRNDIPSEEEAESIPDEIEIVQTTDDDDPRNANAVEQLQAQYQDYMHQDIMNEQNPQYQEYYYTDKSNVVNVPNPQQNILKKNYIELPLGEIPEMKESFYEEQSRYTSSSLSKQLQSSHFGSVTDYHPVHGQLMSNKKVQMMNEGNSQKQSFIQNSEEKQYKSPRIIYEEKQDKQMLAMQKQINNKGHCYEPTQSAPFIQTEVTLNNGIFNNGLIITPHKQRQLSGSNWGTTILKQVSTPKQAVNFGNQQLINQFKDLDTEPFPNQRGITQLSEISPFTKSQAQESQKHFNSKYDSQINQCSFVHKESKNLQNQSMLIQELTPIIENPQPIFQHQRIQSDIPQCLNTIQTANYDIQQYQQLELQNRINQDLYHVLQQARNQPIPSIQPQLHQQYAESQTPLPQNFVFKNQQVVFYNECDTLETDKYQQSSAKKEQDGLGRYDSYEKDKTDKIISYILDNDHPYQNSQKRNGRNGGINIRHSVQLKGVTENSIKKCQNVFASAEDRQNSTSKSPLRQYPVSTFNIQEQAYDNHTERYPDLVDQTIQTDDKHKVRWTEKLDTTTKKKINLTKLRHVNDARCRSVESKSHNRQFMKYKPEKILTTKQKANTRVSLAVMRHTESSAKKQYANSQSKRGQSHRYSSLQRSTLIPNQPQPMKKKVPQQLQRGTRDITPLRSTTVAQQQLKRGNQQKPSQKQQPRQTRQSLIATPKAHKSDSLYKRLTASAIQAQKSRMEKSMKQPLLDDDSQRIASKKRFSKTLFEMSELPSIAIIQRSISVKRQKNQLIVTLAKRKSSVQSNSPTRISELAKPKKVNRLKNFDSQLDSQRGRSQKVVSSTRNSINRVPPLKFSRDRSDTHSVSATRQQPHKHVVINISNNKKTVKQRHSQSVHSNNLPSTSRSATPQVMIVQEDKSDGRSSSRKGSENFRNPFYNSNLASYRETFLNNQQQHSSKFSQDFQLSFIKHHQNQPSTDFQERNFNSYTLEKIHQQLIHPEIQEEDAHHSHSGISYEMLKSTKEEKPNIYKRQAKKLQLENENESLAKYSEELKQMNDFYQGKASEVQQCDYSQTTQEKQDSDSKGKELSHILNQLENSVRSRQSFSKPINSFNTVQQQEFLSFNSQRPSTTCNNPLELGHQISVQLPTEQSNINLIQTPISKDQSKTSSACEQRYSDINSKQSSQLQASPQVQENSQNKNSNYCLPNSLFFQSMANESQLRQSMTQRRSSLKQQSCSENSPNMSANLPQYQTMSSKHENSVIIQSFGGEQYQTQDETRRSRKAPIPKNPNASHRQDGQNSLNNSDTNHSSYSQKVEKQTENKRAQFRTLKLSQDDKQMLWDRVNQHKRSLPRKNQL